MGLVDYSSGSDSGSDSDAPAAKRPRTDPAPSTTNPNPTPPSKPPTRLPPLPASFSAPQDDPAQHQGRARTRAFVDGDYYAHVYVELPVDYFQRQQVDALLAAARARVPGVTVHSLLEVPTPSPTPTTPPPSTPTKARTQPLHISLTHPLPLRADVARTFASRVSAAVRQQRGFAVSLATTKIYHNTASPRRAFLALRVGAGGAGLAGILAAIKPLLRQHRVEAYFDKPEWHASFGWCLDGDGTEGKGGDESEEVDTSPFPPAVLAELEELMPPLRAHVWEVAEVCVKVGKDVVRIPLGR